MRSFSVFTLETFWNLAKKAAIVFLLSVVCVPSVLAASLSFSPASGNYEVGDVFTVGVNAGSQIESLNAVSGVVSFPKDKLEVVSLSKNQSIISLWVQEPSFSNIDGTINFEGIVLNPGYTGTAGRILNITFRVAGAGQASLNFAAGSVLANDGEGSEILSSRGSANYTLTTKAEKIVEEVAIAPSAAEENTDTLPVVSSITNPADGWSSATTGIFKFNLPESVVSMRLLLDSEPDSTPSIVYTPPITERSISDLAEGVSYLHVQYQDQNGWGEVLHYKIQIDTKAPSSFIITEVEPGKFLFDAIDDESGIVRYEVQIDGGPAVEFIDDGNHIYVPPEQLAGKHELSVKAFDAAGNFIMASTTYESLPKPVVDMAVATSKETVTPSTMGTIVSNGTVLITLLSIVVPSFALILLLLFMLYLAWRSVGGLRRRIDKEVAEANAVVHKAFQLLKADLEVDIETLKKATKKRKLTREEAKIMKRLQKNLDEAERVISKEVADIEKELE
jgi:predicted acetyltransferase